MPQTGRPKVKNKIPDELIEKRKCDICKKELNPNKFYNTNNVLSDGKSSICKICTKNLINYNDMQTVYDVLKGLDVPFIYSYWASCKEKNPDDPWTVYIRIANSKMNEFKTFTWKDSIFEPELNNNSINNTLQINDQNNDNFDLNSLKEKFGFGYPDEEYLIFEKKYQQLKPSVKILTTLHDEFFREYCVDRVKETTAKAKGDFKQAKEWASMAKDAATAGKLNPNQMSKSDLSGGMDTFGQMSRMVEETPEGELLGLLPKFIERPKDKVDVVLWCNINYVRDLKGLPSCEYKEIYNFYEERKESYEKNMLDFDLDGEQ